MNPLPSRLSTESNGARCVVTVRYHLDITGQGYHATTGLWDGPCSAPTLPGVRDLLDRMLQGAYVSKCYFELTDHASVPDRVVAWEEFWPTEMSER